jgi:hypothetical protein
MQRLEVRMKEGAEVCCWLAIAMLAVTVGAAQMRAQNTLDINVVQASRSAKMKVKVANSSKKPLRIWKDSNSWGAARWRALVLRNGKLQAFYENPDQDFTVNVPTFDDIARGSHLEKSMDLNDGSWIGPEGKRVFMPGDTLVIIYDVPFTPECLKMGVWYGVTSTSTVVR